MNIYIICIVICAGIFIINGIMIFRAAKERITSEIYIHTGFIIFFSLFALELTLGNIEVWNRFDIPWIRTVGYVLYIPSAFFVVSSLISLKHKGKPKTHDFTASTIFIDTGIYAITRQPMTLGMGIWSIAFVFVFQSILSIILGVLSLFCFWISARKEAEYNIRKFGEVYKEYMKKVPMWNIFKGLKKK